MASAPFADRRWLCLAAPLPALVLGVLIMRRHAVSPAVWGQNLAAGLFFLILSTGLLVLSPRPPRRLWWGAVAVLAVGLVLATFAGAGLEGVHRWVRVGPLHLHASALCLPALILALGKALDSPGGALTGRLAPLLGMVVTGLLALQPDAAQATAFAGALLILLFFRRSPHWMIWPAALAIVTCAALAWMRPDPLLPVPHVEGIVGLASRSGTLWLLASLASLALLPLPFLLARRGEGGASPEALALGGYFCLTLIAPLFGAFPVPLLGFGVSPIVGYFIALAWLVARRPSLGRSLDGPPQPTVHP